MSEPSTNSRLSLVSSVLFELQHNPEGCGDFAAKLCSARQILSEMPEESLPFISNLLELSTRQLGEHPETAACNFFAGQVNKQFNLPQYEKCFEKAFQLRLKLLGPSDKSTVEAAHEYAASSKTWDDSEPGRLRTRAVAIFAMHHGLVQLKTIKILPPVERRLAALEFDNPPLPGAVTLKASVQSKVRLIVDYPEPASDDERIEVLNRTSRALERNRFMSPDFPDVSEALHEVTSLYNKLEADAELWTKYPAVEHWILATLMEHQGLKEFDRANYTTAAKLFDTVQKIRTAVLPSKHADIALSQFRRAAVSVQLGELSAAEELYLEANDSIEPVRDHQVYLHAGILHNLGALHMRRGTMQAADRLFERAMGQLNKVPDSFQQTKVCRENLQRAKNTLASS